MKLNYVFDVSNITTSSLFTPLNSNYVIGLKKNTRGYFHSSQHIAIIFSFKSIFAVSYEILIRKQKLTFIVYFLQNIMFYYEIILLPSKYNLILF